MFLQDVYIPTSKEKESVFILWTGKEKEINLKIRLAIPDTSVDVYGLLLGREENELTLNIQIEHEQQNTKSHVILKGLLTDKTKVKFNGLVTINNGAKQSDTWLSCYYLLLSPHAKGQAIPSLEIKENDVKAGHATTASKPSAQELFYLQSRGFNAQQARHLLVEGFVEDLIHLFSPDLQQEARKELAHGF